MKGDPVRTQVTTVADMLEDGNAVTTASRPALPVVPERVTEEVPSLKELTEDEAQFVYACEVLGLPARVAAAQAGMAAHKVSAPHLQQARTLLKQQIRGEVNISKEDVVFGIREAIDRAKIINEPSTEIMGWDRIAKLLGYDAPQKIDLSVTATIEVLKNNVRSMDDRLLAEMVGANNIIDVDFYPAEDA